jgi:Iap family predicted aminopeptidase
MAGLRTSGLDELEARLIAEVSTERLWDHVRTIAQWERISGTPGERSAVEYFDRCLHTYGVETTIHEFDSLLGWPQNAELEVIAGHTHPVKAITHAFVPSTPPQGTEAEVVYVKKGEDADFAEAGANGKIALVEGLASPVRVLRAQQAGVVGLVFINEDRLHDMCVSPIWGTPTTRTAHLLPNMPAVSILRRDGEALKALTAQGGLRVRLRTETFWDWKRTPILTGTIPGSIEPQQFVLFSGHHCSWYFGAMDNGSANATMLEVARILSANRRHLRRSVRLAFWPGHTQGRYSGSTWYFDNFWEDLHDHCVLHVNIDSTGARGASAYKALAMPETSEFAVSSIQDSIGFHPEPERQSRAGDQSFWGCGVPSVYMDLSQVPAELTARAAAGSGLFQAADQPQAAAQPGLPWWWHTPDDTVDKIDVEVLVRDSQVYVLANLRAATAALLPFRYEPAAGQILERIEAYAEMAAGRVDLEPATRRARHLRSLAANLDRLVERAPARVLDDPTLAAVNARLLAMDRELVLINFSAEGPFDQDLAIPIPAVPLLAPARRLRDLDATSSEAHFLATELTRNRNKVTQHLRRAIEAGEAASAALEQAMGE